ncbi:hypothetical protein, partial [Erwinia tasmaniensis]|uniref:DUF7657 domain-containing protein n=1 Tax=Erwinia tasmaniensis TaxID=338565 RepID=UPI003A4D39ED
MIKFLKLSHEKFFLITFFIVGVFYVCNCWSPSSYGVFLKQFDPYNTGLIWGTPRDIRSDEWGVVTPLIQATVNNKYERYNKTSFYDEDLRINYALPIHDWGLIFKPTMLGYTFLTPAHAYSLQWYLVFFIFIFGYFKLLKRIGMPAVVSLSLAFTLYFSGFSQFWWDEKGPLFSFFPWIVLILLSKLSVPKKTFIYYWLATSWMITDFYPPIIISLGFVGALIYLAYEKNILDAKKIIALIISTACAVATALFYLKDYLVILPFLTEAISRIKSCVEYAASACSHLMP